jgi:hypothetical protein
VGTLEKQNQKYIFFKFDLPNPLLHPYMITAKNLGGGGGVNFTADLLKSRGLVKKFPTNDIFWPNSHFWPKIFLEGGYMLMIFGWGV